MKMAHDVLERASEAMTRSGSATDLSRAFHSGEDDSSVAQLYTAESSYWACDSSDVDDCPGSPESPRHDLQLGLEARLPHKLKLDAALAGDNSSTPRHTPAGDPFSCLAPAAHESCHDHAAAGFRESGPEGTPAWAAAVARRAQRWTDTRKYSAEELESFQVEGLAFALLELTDLMAQDCDRSLKPPTHSLNCCVAGRA